MNTYLKPTETADRLRCTVGTLANWRSRGIGPTYVRIGRSILYPLENLIAYEAERLVEAVAA